MKSKLTELASFTRLPGGDSEKASGFGNGYTSFGSSPAKNANANLGSDGLPVSHSPGEFAAFGMAQGPFAPDRDTADIFTDRDLLLDANQMRYLRRQRFLCFDITDLS